MISLSPLYREKIIIGFLVAFFVFFAELQHVVAFVIVLGLGHFFLTHVAQGRGGKIRLWHVVLYISLLLFLFFLAFLYSQNALFQPLLLFVTAIYFLVHFLLDEHLMTGEPFSFRTLINIIPIIVLYAGFILDSLFATGVLLVCGVVGIVIFVLNGVWRVYYKEYPSSSTMYFSVITCVLIAMFAIGATPNVLALFGFIVLYHYLGWYVFYFHKISRDSLRVKRYIREVLVVNSVIIFLFLLFSSTENVVVRNILEFFFLQTSFFIWTLLHVMFTTRVQDYKMLLR